MEWFIVILTGITFVSVFRSFLIIRKAKKQISEMSEALADVRSGNGNRRILAETHELVAPLTYEINDIINTAESTPGKGTVFVLLFPLAK